MTAKKLSNKILNLISESEKPLGITRYGCKESTNIRLGLGIAGLPMWTRVNFLRRGTRIGL
jgi:hypothetical protein